MKTTPNVILYVFVIVFSTFTYAQEKEDLKLKTPSEFKHAISACPVAVVFGIYSVNYEFLYQKKHGFVARFDYEAIPKTYTEARIESSGYSFILNYRYHFNKQMNSYFAGAYGRYRQFNGEGKINETNFEFTMPDVSFGINAGRKWVWKSGFTLTFALGYGFSNEDWNSKPNTHDVNEMIRDFRRDYDFIDPFYGEFSIGYSF